MRIFVYLIVVLVLASGGLAQEAPTVTDPATVPADQPTTTVTSPPDFWSVFWKGVSEDQGLPTYLAGLFVAALVGFGGYWKVQLEKMKKRLGDPFILKLPKIQRHALNAIVVGNGGTGKTSIVRALSACEAANPDVANANNRTYSLVNEVSVSAGETEKHRRLTRIYISDHVGQNYATILDTDFKKNEKWSALRRCVIVVVDLFAPAAHGKRVAGKAEFDAKRIDENIDDVGGNAFMDILKGMMRDDDVVVLFINKVDAMKSVSEQVMEDAKREYQSLIDKLSIIRGVQLHVIVGSAMNGRGLVGSSAEHAPKNLLSILVDSSTLVA